jgi:hypothetical protein
MCDETGNGTRAHTRRTLAAIVAGLAVVATPRAAEPPAGGTVELPPMMVEESIASAPWLYAHVGGIEFLSRCSAYTTRTFIEAWLEKSQLVRVLVPEEFLARMDVPSVFVLYTQDLKQTVSAEIQRELDGGDKPRRKGEPPRERINIAPNMRLSDRDMHASIVYFDEALFEPAAVSVAPGHVRFLLQRRLPELPAWAIDGVERAWRSTDFVLDPITFRPLVWQSFSESEALTFDPARPRAVLPANELFANDVVRAAESRHSRRVETRAATQELFFRWATIGNPTTRKAYWTLAQRAADAPLTESVFEEIFGFDFAELRDRLSDYLPKAVGETARIDSGKLPPLPEIDVQRATPNEIARVRGEWERLAIGHVQRRLPQVREPYIAQARRTLRRAYDAGDRDPRLLATMGLCEIDAGNEAGARQFLEPAVLAGVVRPRAYHELARIRFDELRRGAPPAKMFSYTELAPVIDPLRRSLKQSPPLAESYVMLADAWACCEYAPNAEECTELETGARLFARRATVVLPIARALAQHGRKSEAAAILDACTGSPIDKDTQLAINRLREGFAAAPASAAADR